MTALKASKLHRLVLDVSVQTHAALVEALQLEETEDIVYLSKHTQCRRWTLRGVPARRFDVLVQELSDKQKADNMVWVLEINMRAGRFDSEIRPQLYVRVLRPEDVLGLKHGHVEVAESNIQLMSGTDKVWELKLERLKSDLSGYLLSSIMFWHHKRFYKFLEEDMVHSLCEEFTLTMNMNKSLAEANRLASRMLYRLATDEGWCKLTKKQQQKHGVDTQWHKAEKIWNASGVGQYTLDSANPQ